jgi:hypothetical protein
MRTRHPAGEAAGTHQQQRARVGQRQQACRKRRRRGGAAQRQRLAIQQRSGGAGGPVEHQHAGLHGLGRRGPDRDHLDDDHRRVPCRHQQQRVAIVERVLVAARHLGAGAERRLDGTRQRHPRQRGMNLVG